MKVSVCGKRGNGKSAVAVLPAHGLHRRDRRVPAVDCDESHACLHGMPGFRRPPRPPLELVGGKKSVRRWGAHY